MSPSGESHEDREPDSLPSSSSTAETTQQEMYYFDQLVINPMKIRLSLNMHGSKRILSGLPLGRVLGNIDKALIQLHGLTLNSPFVSKEELTSRITKHYKQALLLKMYKIIGSVEILGNPMSLMSNMGTGVYDFFNEPAQAIVHSPADFGVGLKRGTSSLVHKSAYGIANSAGQLTGGIAHLASFLTFDDKFQQEWTRSYRAASEQPRTAVDGFQRAAHNAGNGVFQALCDVVYSPLQGARAGGASGALLGAFRGTMGIVVKPVVTIFGSASLMAQGIGNNLMNWENDRTRTRLPRYIDDSGVLRNYNPEAAAGNLLLQCLGGGKYAREWYQQSFDLADGLLVVSDQHCLVVKDSSVTWDVELGHIRGLQLTTDCVVVKHHVKSTSSFDVRSYFAAKASPDTYLYPAQADSTVPLYEIILNAAKAHRNALSPERV